MYAGVRQITNWIFINWARWIGIEYLIVAMIILGRLEYSIVGMIRWGGWELNIQLSEILGLRGSELNI